MDDFRTDPGLLVVDLSNGLKTKLIHRTWHNGISMWLYYKTFWTRVEAWTVEISMDLDLSSSNLLFGMTTKDVPLEEAAHGVRQPL
jgi:hypothetical protein